MIDAQGAAVAAVLANRFDEQAVTSFAMALRVGRRESPILSIGCEIVGRRTDTAPGREKAPVRPQIGSELVGSQREVMIQPDGEAAPGVLVRTIELADGTTCLATILRRQILDSHHLIDISHIGDWPAYLATLSP